MQPKETITPIGEVHTVQSLAKAEPAFPEGSTRWIIHQHRDKLLAAGAIFYNGRKLLIDRDCFISVIKEGLVQ